jgi:hypothetical protein
MDQDGDLRLVASDIKKFSLEHYITLDDKVKIFFK